MLVYKLRVKLQYLSLKLKTLILLITFLTSSKVVLVLGYFFYYLFFKYHILKVITKNKILDNYKLYYPETLN